MSDILKKLKAINQKINENTLDASEDNLERDRSVVILQDFDLHQRCLTPQAVQYNGWLQDLQNLIKELEK